GVLTTSLMMVALTGHHPLDGPLGPHYLGQEGPNAMAISPTIPAAPDVVFQFSFLQGAISRLEVLNTLPNLNNDSHCMVIITKKWKILETVGGSPNDILGKKKSGEKLYDG
ncbi:hypothetical protein HAX54_042186, partial [Datura stramonium]|nr:hypothetical protein [Datura stramonium]